MATEGQIEYFVVKQAFINAFKELKGMIEALQLRVETLENKQ